MSTSHYETLCLKLVLMAKYGECYELREALRENMSNPHTKQITTLAASHAMMSARDSNVLSIFFKCGVRVTASHLHNIINQCLTELLVDGDETNNENANQRSNKKQPNSDDVDEDTPRLVKLFCSAFDNYVAHGVDNDAELKELVDKIVRYAFKKYMHEILLHVIKKAPSTMKFVDAGIGIDGVADVIKRYTSKTKRYTTNRNTACELCYKFYNYTKTTFNNIVVQINEMVGAMSNG